MQAVRQPLLPSHLASHDLSHSVQTHPHRSKAIVLAEPFKLGNGLGHSIVDHVAIHVLSECVHEDNVSSSTCQQLSQQALSRPRARLGRYAHVIHCVLDKHQVAVAVYQIPLHTKDSLIATSCTNRCVLDCYASFRKGLNKPSDDRFRPSAPSP
jgi:hypothetical protein